MVKELSHIGLPLMCSWFATRGGESERVQSAIEQRRKQAVFYSMIKYGCYFYLPRKRSIE